MNKFFFITIDTEADNQWDIKNENTTQNVEYLPRFQELAEKFGFKPTWLITYEIARDKRFINYFRNKQDNSLCEIGMHLHAWSTPPKYDLKITHNERPYLIEYPKDIMEEKIVNLTNTITENFGQRPISHRSGRWCIDDTYIKLLEKHGYRIDCSVTPYINWKKNRGATGLGGSNYKSFPKKDYYISDNMLEIPVTIRKIRSIQIKRIRNIKKLFRELQLFFLGRNQWIRPDRSFVIDDILKVIDKCDENNEYIMFMIHSSELMPNGSPNFKSKSDIEKLYKNIESIFEYISKKGYVGITLKDFYKNNGKGWENENKRNSSKL